MKIKDELGNIILVPKRYEKKVRKLILGDDTAELEILIRKFGGAVPKYQKGTEPGRVLTEPERREWQNSLLGWVQTAHGGNFQAAMDALRTNPWNTPYAAQAADVLDWAQTVGSGKITPNTDPLAGLVAQGLEPIMGTMVGAGLLSDMPGLAASLGSRFSKRALPDMPDPEISPEDLRYLTGILNSRGAQGPPLLTKDDFWTQEGLTKATRDMLDDGKIFDDIYDKITQWFGENSTMTGNEFIEMFPQFGEKLKRTPSPRSKFSTDEQLYNTRLQLGLEGYNLSEASRGAIDYSNLQRIKNGLDEVQPWWYNQSNAGRIREMLNDYGIKEGSSLPQLNPSVTQMTPPQLNKYGGPRKKQMGGAINTTGYTPGTDTYNNPYNIIPGGDITMRNTPFPVMGYPLSGNSNVGMPVLMYPGKDYKFPGASGVLEVPIKQTGDVAAPATKPKYETDGDIIFEVSEDGLQYTPALSIPQTFKEKAREAYVAEGNPPESFDDFWVKGLQSKLASPDFSLDSFKQAIEKDVPKTEPTASAQGVADMRSRLLGQGPKQGQKPTLLGGQAPQMPTFTLGQPAAAAGTTTTKEAEDPSKLVVEPPPSGPEELTVPSLGGLFPGGMPTEFQGRSLVDEYLYGPSSIPYHKKDEYGNWVPVPADELGQRRAVESVTGFDPGARLDEILKGAEEKIKQLEGLNQEEYQKALQDYSGLLGDLRGYARGQAASAMLGNIAQNPYTQAVLKQQGLADAARKARRIPQYFLDVQRAEAESQMNAMANEMLASGARPSEVASMMAPYYEKLVGQQNDLAMKVYASNAAADADYYSFLTSLQNENIAADVQNRNAILAGLNKKIATSADIGTDLLRNLAALRAMETSLPRSAAQTMFGNEMNLLRSRLGLDRDRIGVDIYKDQQLLDEKRRAEARAMDEQRRRDAEAARAEQERKRKEEADKKAAEKAAKTKAEADAEKEVDAKLTDKEPVTVQDEDWGDPDIESTEELPDEETQNPFDPEISLEEPAAAEPALPFEFKSDSPLDQWGVDLGALDPELEKEALTAFPWLPSLNQVSALAREVQGAIDFRGTYISPRTARIIEEGIKEGRFVRDPKTKIVLSVPVKVGDTILWDPKNPNASSITRIVENLERLGLIKLPK